MCTQIRPEMHTDVDTQTCKADVAARGQAQPHITGLCRWPEFPLSLLIRSLPLAKVSIVCLHAKAVLGASLALPDDKRTSLPCHERPHAGCWRWSPSWTRDIPALSQRLLLWAL